MATDVVVCDLVSHTFTARSGHELRITALFADNKIVNMAVLGSPKVTAEDIREISFTTLHKLYYTQRRK